MKSVLKDRSAAPVSDAVASTERRGSARLAISVTLLALLAFVAINFVVQCCWHSNAELALTKASLGNVQEAMDSGRPGAWWMAQGYLDRKTAPGVVVLGSSLLGCLQAADADKVNQNRDYVLDHSLLCLEQLLAQKHINLDTYGLGMVGNMISDHYLIDRALFTPGRLPKVVILTVAPRDFIDSGVQSIASTEAFRFYTPYVKDSEYTKEAFADPLEAASWYVTNRLPLRSLFPAAHVAPGNWNAPQDSNKPKGRLNQDPLLFVDAGSMANLRPGQCVITPGSGQWFADNTYDYIGRYLKPNGSMLHKQNVFLDKLLADLQEKGIKTIVINMPLTIANKALLTPAWWATYRTHLSQSCQKYHAQFKDLTTDDYYDGSCFVDCVHMNSRGGAKLASVMADEIASALK